MESLVVQAQMLIRRPVADVFAAFVDPDTTRRFWFTRSSGRVEQGTVLRWEWEMYGAGTDVRVKEVVPNSRIVVEWDDPPTTVEWQFTPASDDTTLVRISNHGFHGTPDEIVAQALDAKGGFTVVLAGLKAFIEHGLELRLVADQYPEAHASGGVDRPNADGAS